QASSSAAVTFGYSVGRYKPPSGASPPSRIWENESGAAWPRVETYCMAGMEDESASGICLNYKRSRTCHAARKALNTFPGPCARVFGARCGKFRTAAIPVVDQSRLMICEIVSATLVDSKPLTLVVIVTPSSIALAVCAA